MIQNQRDLFPVEHLGQPRLVELGDGHRGGDIVAQHQIQLALHQLAGDNMLQAGVPGQDLWVMVIPMVGCLLFISVAPE